MDAFPPIFMAVTDNKIDRGKELKSKVASLLRIQLYRQLPMTMTSHCLVPMTMTMSLGAVTCIQSVTSLDTDREHLSPFVASAQNKRVTIIWTQTCLNSLLEDVI